MEGIGACLEGVVMAADGDLGRDRMEEVQARERNGRVLGLAQRVVVEGSICQCKGGFLGFNIRCTPAVVGTTSNIYRFSLSCFLRP